MESQKKMTCHNLPSLLSSFVDTFVDFSVSGGLFLLPPIDNDPYHAPPLQTIYPQPTRLIAIGDLHGDLTKAKQALRLAGLIDNQDRWSGGSTTLVQVGDIFDRGGDELKLLYLFEKLKREAARAGGTIITMNGNHEIMNVDGDFRFATPEGLEEFKEWAMWYGIGNDMKKLCQGLKETPIKDPFDGLPLGFPNVKREYFGGIRSRIAAVKPDGPIANRFLSKNPTVVVVGDSVFAHGGLLPRHVEYGLERANEEVRDWIRGVKDKVEKELVKGRNSIVWSRKFSHEVAKDCDCSTLEHVLETIPGVKRMIVGHTIQQHGINGACGNKAIRIDVGMSRGCGNGLPEVLEIKENSEVRVLTSNPIFQRGYEAPLTADKKDGIGLLIPEIGRKQVEVLEAYWSLELSYVNFYVW